MSCCKAKIYGWCKDLPVVDYKDEEGKEYCVFHAPKGKKGIPLEEFNKLVFERINKVKHNMSIPKASPSGPVLRKIEEIKPCDLSGTIFEGDIDFTRCDPLPPIKFSGAIFNENVNFENVKFSGEANFFKVIFNGMAIFAMTTFMKEAYFREAKFNQRAHFWRASFTEKAHFDFTTFVKLADFSEVTLDKEAYFIGATFNEEADFTGISFNKEGYFWGKTFKRKTSFRAVKIEEKIRFEGVDFRTLSLIDTDLRKMNFINCSWPKKSGRYALYDELLLFNYGNRQSEDKNTKNFLQKLKRRFKGSFSWILKREWNGFKKDISCDKAAIKKVEILYRQLKQEYKEEHNDPEVSNWHYGEKEMFRKGNRLRRFFPVSISNLYWLSSGYGERPVRAGVFLIFLILGISILMALSGLVPSTEDSIYSIKSIKGVTDILNFHKLKALILNTLQYATFQKEPVFKPEPESLIGAYLKLLAQILIPLQTALFALAVRNRFRR